VGLYLAVFASEADDEVDGVEVGGYGDFHTFRVAVHDRLERGNWGSRYPTLMNHEDARGVWTPEEARSLARELDEIRQAFRSLPAVDFADGWQREVASSRKLRPASLHESFFDIDGEPLLDRLVDLAKLADRTQQPIWFQ
jgi:hypothetical protein